MTTPSTPTKDELRAITQFQDQLRNYLLDQYAHYGIKSDIDGGGCDSGDWRDFSMAELRMGVGGICEHYQDKLDDMRTERDHWITVAKLAEEAIDQFSLFNYKWRDNGPISDAMKAFQQATGAPQQRKDGEG